MCNDTCDKRGHPVFKFHSRQIVCFNHPLLVNLFQKRLHQSPLSTLLFFPGPRGTFVHPSCISWLAFWIVETVLVTCNTSAKPCSFVHTIKGARSAGYFAQVYLHSFSP